MSSKEFPGDLPEAEEAVVIKPALATRLHNIVEPNATNEKAMSIYREWAQQYDADLAEIGRRTPAVAAEEINTYLNDQKDAYILDIGAGTGHLGHELQRRGFSHLDALDASPEMLQQARNKGIYKNLICTTLGPDRLPIATDTYDAIVAVSCFAPGHITSNCFEELIRITRPGGSIIILMKEAYLTTPQFEGIFEPAMQRHQDNGCWKLVMRKVLPHFSRHWKECNGLLYILQPGV